MLRDKSCAECGKDIHRMKKNAKYCSNHCRFSAWQRGAATYEGCTYCDAPADQQDHVPPRSLRPMLSAEARERYPYMIVPCCRECNGMLWSRPFLTVAMRKQFIGEELRRKYEDELSSKPWTDREIADMSGTAKVDIVSYELHRVFIRNRIKFALGENAWIS